MKFKNVLFLSKKKYVRSILECIKVFSRVSKLIVVAFPRRWFSCNVYFTTELLSSQILII